MVARFKLKVLTPMFMGGANPKDQPELRAASIRGAMRFWFRAIAGAVTSNPHEVYELESEVFGNTEKKSKVVVRVKTKLSENDFQKLKLLPHKTFRAWAILPDKEFDIELEVKESHRSGEYLNLAFYSFWLSTALGGWGKRSRRGAGTVIIDKERSDIPEEFKKFLSKELKEQLDIIKSVFDKNLKPQSEKKKVDWPYLVEVREWKKKFPDVWEGDSPIVDMFRNYSRFIRNNGDCLGQIKPKRYASPIVIRVIPKGNEYSLRFTLLRPDKEGCDEIIRYFLSRLGETEEVWHA